MKRNRPSPENGEGFSYIIEFMSAALGLYRLQQVDSRIGQIEARLDKIREVLENDEELRGAMTQVETAGAEKLGAERARQKSEQEAHDQQLKIQQAESSLYGGSVKNPKELQDLQADIASLKKHLSTLEERELESMLQVEAAESGLETARKHLDEIQSRRGDEHRTLLAEQDSLTRDLESLQSERQAAADPIASQAIRTYEELRQDKRGVAVVEINDNACGACGTTLAAGLQQNVRHAENLILCPTCGRILYTS